MAKKRTAKKGRKAPEKTKPERLWSMKPSDRPKDAGGSVAAVLTASPAIKYVSLARGRYTKAMHALDDRATIRAGISAIKQAGLGYDDVDPAKLHSGLVATKKADAKLLSAAGTGDTLGAAASGMRRKVVKLGGTGLARAAWGLRGLYVLAAYSGFAAVQGAAAIGVNFIPVAGQIASAAIAAKGGVEGAVIAKANKDFQGMVKDGLGRAAPAKPKSADKAINTALASSFSEGGEADPAQVATAKAGPPMALVVGGVAAAALVLVLLLRRRTHAQ